MENLTESPAKAQRKAAEVLVTLLAEPLPVVTWTVNKWAVLNGQAEPYGQARPDLAAWAAHLGTTVAEERSKYDNRLRGNVHATVDGVTVRVWALIKDAPEARP